MKKQIWILAATLLLLPAPQLMAQGHGQAGGGQHQQSQGNRQGRGMGMHHYDPASEVTLSGTVEQLITQTGRRNRTGLHLLFQSDGEKVEVHVGPTVYLQEIGLDLSEGDQLTITGVRATVDEKEALLARKIIQGEKEFELRDARGIPLWSQGSRRNRR